MFLSRVLGCESDQRVDRRGMGMDGFLISYVSDGMGYCPSLFFVRSRWVDVTTAIIRSQGFFDRDVGSHLLSLPRPVG